MIAVEWVETTGKTVDEARELALDQLGVDASEAEFELLEEPKSGLFGRTRGAARVRARVAPVVPQPKTERRRKQRKADDDGRQRGGAAKAADKGAKQAPASTDSEAAPKPASAKASGSNNDRRDAKNGRGGRSPQAEREPMDNEEQISTLEEFLQGLLQAFGVAGDVTATLVDNELRANVAGEDLGLLVGSRLGTLDAIQDVARHALQRQAAGREYAKVIVDVADVRIRRREALTSFVEEAAQRVRDEDVEVVFEVMTSVDRKQVHDLVGELDGVSSSSEGEDPRRRVVLRKG